LIIRGLICASDFEVYSLHGPTEMGFAQKGEVALPVWSLSLRFSAYLCDLCVKKAISAQRSQRYAENRREKSSPSHFLQSHGDAIV
jgi:hypothetical protein